MIQSLLHALKKAKRFACASVIGAIGSKYTHILSVRMQMAWDEPYVSVLDLSCIDPGDVSAKDKGNEEKCVFSGFKTMESHWMVWSGQWAAKVVSGQHIIESGILGYNSNSLLYYRSCILKRAFQIQTSCSKMLKSERVNQYPNKRNKGGNCTQTWSDKSPIVQVWQTACRPESGADCYITSCSLGFSCQKCCHGWSAKILNHQMHYRFSAVIHALFYHGSRHKLC